MKKTSLLELAKILNIPCRNCMKTKAELEEAIKDTITVYDQKLMGDTMRKLAWKGLQKNIVMDTDTMIDKRIGEVLNPELIRHTKRISFRPIFIVFIDYKIISRREEELHNLNGIDTMGT